MGKRFSFRNPPELPAYPRRRRRLCLSLTTLVDFPNCLDNFEMKNGSSSIRVQGVEQFIDVTQPLTGAMHYPSKSKVAARDENRQPQVGHRCSLLPRAVLRGVVPSASITTCYSLALDAAGVAALRNSGCSWSMSIRPERGDTPARYSGQRPGGI